jgi:hypothetical protein
MGIKSSWYSWWWCILFSHFNSGCELKFILISSDQNEWFGIMNDIYGNNMKNIKLSNGKIIRLIEEKIDDLWQKY